MNIRVHKLLTAVTGALLAASLLAGCAQDSGSSADAGASSEAAKPKTKITIVAINGPTGVGLANLKKSSDAGETANEYAIRFVSSPEEAKAAITGGTADIAAVPTNLAATLYNKTSGAVRMVAVNTLGVLHIVENGASIQSVADLKGKTILSTGQGSNPEYVLNYVLTKNGLTPQKDVKIEYVQQNEEMMTSLIAGKYDIAMVPEPMATTVLSKKDTLRRALDITAEWDKVSGGSRLMMGCVAGRQAFLQDNAQAVSVFLGEYEASVKKVSEDADGTAALCAEYGIISSADIAKNAFPGCNITFVAGKDMKTQIAGYFEALAAADAKSVGGKLPADDFYYGAA